jgi:hypothetical protein
MATSGTYVWEMTRDQIITDALGMVGAIDESDTPNTAQITKAARFLNGIIKTLPGQIGLPLWATKQQAVTLTATAQYTCGIGQTVNIAKPLKIVQAWRHDNVTGADTPLEIVSIDTYNRLGKKDVTGPPVQVAYVPDNPSGVLYMYPTPDTYAIANCQVYIRYHRPFQDFNAALDTPDFPTEWDLPVTFLLAHALGPSFGLPKQDQDALKEKATMYAEMAQELGYENASLFIQPAYNQRK